MSGFNQHVWSLKMRTPGRPREFDMDTVLDRAIAVFTERGYYGTSVTDLTGATGVAQGSLYKAFQDKRAIFIAAFQRYRTLRANALSDALEGSGTGLERIRRLLSSYAEMSQGDAGRRGCLVVTSAAEFSNLDIDVAQQVSTAMDRNEALLVEHILWGQADGSVAREIDATTAARMMLCLMQGMRVVGKTGRTRQEMQAVADLAMKIVSR